jgi:hypothetical protein
MINNELITDTEIPLLDLIYGEMKNRMYSTQCAIDDGNGADSNFHYLEGLLDAYGFVYTEIDRIMNIRGEK